MPTRRLALTLSVSLLAAASLPGCAATASSAAAADSVRTLRPYRSEAELQQALGQWRSQAEKLQLQRRRDRAPLAMQAAPAAPPAPAAAAAAKSADSAGAAAESITNVQTAGVDEGGIVKRAGDYLVILRRGRLFTVRVGGDALQPAATLDAYAPNADPGGAWYDELLISGNTVVVVGYSYARGGTEIGLFELGDGGALAYRATYHLRSFDYYSARNYASRLIGRKLVFYSPTILQPWGPQPAQLMPGVRRWQGAATPAEFERILPATRIYRTDDEFDATQPLALHTVTACDLGAAEMRCESTAVLGPAGRVFYVSQGSVYVWTSSWPRRRVVLQPATPQAGVPQPAQPQPGTVPPTVPPTGPLVAAEPAPAPQSLSAVFRIPLDGTTPTALKTAGVPIDQLSFLEDGRGFLHVLLRDSGFGEGMWGSDRGGGGQMALLRVPLSAFGDGRGAAQREHYRVLPAVAGYGLQNRFIGDWLLWGGANAAWATRYADAGSPQALAPGHAVERIEAMGAHAVLVGNAGKDLLFTSLRLGRSEVALAGSHVQAGARQGETRTHGFFFRATGAEEGLLGLPVLGGPGTRRGAVLAGAQGSAAVLFLRQRNLDFHALGELGARAATQDDGCKASCVDWYGNARPIFLGERVFALMGYELVEGRLEGQGSARGAGERLGERIDERRRISFAPHLAARNGRYSPFN
ncbi:beta-propeller domain-containing protein [Aquabacterium sp.]|uniref:beta-propeller domain-containing protein n=1 Tax=Aquabacterium sp. TaxID=1872578 RepID=UPI002C86850B|nr:beta-propeller domain-containing protein [Aquabacterium sp.]HSW07480.1 beta-propeller domain-containing protein [Aquabacterium sp.]